MPIKLATDFNVRDITEPVNEMIQDRVAQVVSHMQNNRTTIKKSTITIKIEMSPDDNRQNYDIAITSGVTLAPTKHHPAKLVGGEDAEGRIVVGPAQTRLSLP